MSRKPIMVGYDGSTGAQEALAFAVAAAQACESDLEVLHAWLPAPLASRFVAGYSGPSDDVLQATAEAVLAEALGRAKAAGPAVEVRGRAVRGAAADVLLEAAEQAQMLVVGSRGLGGFGGLLMGSIGIQVGTHAACPVVVVRPSGLGLAPGPEAGRVVVGVDGSPGSQAAFEFALEQAACRRVGLTAVVSLDLPTSLSPSRWGALPDDVVAADPQAGAARLHHTLDSWRGDRSPEVDLRAQVAKTGPAARALVEASAGALLLVVGSRGLGGFRSLLLGSVGHAVLHHAHGPVAVVHPHTVEADQPDTAAS